ncbi:unnamed protein product [Rotaria sp. Silwood1]|nr:unnamed protein product [Rotaria sp. Silwood1]CAF1191938.1 unnamed protein product [Rotaria sp. Silwood1]CAF3474459.1 unnamed protein product [Rotaria sp. Silwood1]CAF4878523.1 unnamed protein product [Rotaria sp. Silwood1]
MNLLLTALNTTTSPPSSDTNTPLWIGYISVIIAVIFFGSNLVPAGKYPIGDGLSFQFFMCCGIWIVGLIIDLFVKSPQFFPLVLIGGILWTTGNILSIFVIRINGLGMSMLIWCTTNMLVGWASGHFGWFGLLPENVEQPILNYIGVTIACLSGIAFLAIRTIKQEETIQNLEEQQPILQSLPIVTTCNDATPIDTTTITVSSTSSKSLYIRIIGCLLATIAGILFGFIFIPSTYIQDHPNIYQAASKNGLHYVFAMYSGIFFSSMFYYLVYIAYKGNRPYLHIQSIFPAIISGIMWGIAQAGFLVANSVLSQAISFPLITIGPSTIAVFWSIFYFKEIFGRKNYLIIIIGTLFRIISAILIILSKPIPR